MKFSLLHSDTLASSASLENDFRKEPPSIANLNLAERSDALADINGCSSNLGCFPGVWQMGIPVRLSTSLVFYQSTQGAWGLSHLTCARIDASFRTRVQDAVSGKFWEMLCVHLWTTVRLLSHVVLTSARTG